MEETVCEDHGEKAKTGSKKKPRRRIKAIHSKIKEQMEFYFSDANLHKDRFLKKSIHATSDGYIPLTTFLQFNKIRALTDEVSVLADAFSYNSDLLEVNSEKTHIRRLTPITEPKNVDARTVYAEHLPHNVDHDWVKKLFSTCGKVAYVSLPRYASTGDMKGFAFVEFETIEGATAACEELNNPPADAFPRVGMFPKSSHQMDAVKKQLPEEQIKATEEKAKEVVLSGKTVEDNMENSGDKLTTESENIKTLDQATEKSDHKKSKRHRSNSDSSIDGGQSATDTGVTAAKRKKSEVSFDLPPEETKSIDNEKTVSAKKKSKKRKSRSKTVDSVSSEGENVGGKLVEDDVNKTDEIVPAKKQKLSADIDKGGAGDGEKDTTDTQSDSDVNKGDKDGKENSTKTNKKKRFRKKKNRKEKVVPAMRVIPKKDWLLLRKEYLKLQKTSVTMLKKTLGELKQGKQKELEKEDTKKAKPMQFIPDVIVKVTADVPMTRKNLKDVLPDDIHVAYIDLKDGQQNGYIRCQDAQSATSTADVKTDGHTYTLIAGEEEKSYWDKLISDRETKFNTKCKHKKRGHQKWMEKAQKASVESVEKRHIVFDDE